MARSSSAADNPTHPEDLPDAYRPYHDCSLTMGDLRALTAEQPEEIRAAILAQPGAFLAQATALLHVEAPILTLVDKQHRLGSEYRPNDLVPLERYADRLVLNREGLSLRAVIMPDFLAMVEAARLDGILLDVSSSYRSYVYQENLFAYWVEQLGQEEAERVSARPGTSQHQLGTTIDFGSVTEAFAEHPAGRWLKDNAHRYGFSLSYPQGYESLTGYAWEPWHFRWLSREGTAMERTYFGGVQQRFLEFWRDAEPTIRNACTISPRRDTVSS